MFWKVNSPTHTNTRWLNPCYVGIAIALFVLSAAVGVTIDGGFMIWTPSTSSAVLYFILLPTARALSFVGFLLVLFALILLFAAVGTIPPIMAKY